MANDTYQDDSMLNEAERKVLQVISLFNRPVTVYEISEEMAIPLKKASLLFKSLQKKGNIVMYSSEQGGRNYYAPTTSKNGLDALLSQKYADIAGSLEKQYADVKSENESLRHQIDKLYANILTLMGIFVAIFALIVINVNAIGSFAENMENSGELFLTLVKLNIPLVISIVVLVLLMKVLLLSKRNGKNRNTKKL